MNKRSFLVLLLSLVLPLVVVMPHVSPAMAFDYDWEEDKPDGDLDDISNGDDQMRDDKKAIRERLSEDHHWVADEDGETGIGFHKAIHMIDQTAATTDTETFYNNGGDIYWHDVTGNQIKMTSDGGINAAGIKGTVPAASLGNAFPTGGFALWPTDTAPTGWLLCYGQAVSRETYATLFAVIGTTFGTGDGSTTFNLPDFRGRIPLGQDDMGGSSANRVTDSDADTLGGADGVESVTLTAAQSGLPAHNHPLPYGGSDSGANQGGYPEQPYNTATYGGTSSQNGINVTAANASEAHTNMPPFLTVNYIIKY